MIWEKEATRSHQKDMACQNHHQRDTPSSNHRHQGGHGRRRGGTRQDNPLQEFPNLGVLPPDENETQCLKWKAIFYINLDGELFKRGSTIPLLKFLNNQQMHYVMWELHEGIYDLHIGGRSLATKVVCAGYYWLTLRVDTLDFTRQTKNSQTFHAPFLTTSIA